MLDLAHSAGDDDRSHSTNPGAESADGFEARAHACVNSMLCPTLSPPPPSRGVGGITDLTRP